MIQINRNKLIDYFREMATPAGERKIGLELEHFVVDSKTGETISYYNGIEELLQELVEDFPHQVQSQGHLIGLSDDDIFITLEPGAQLEVSLTPHESIQGIRSNYRRFLCLITPYLEKRGWNLVNLGYHPKTKAADMPLIPKKRYELMDAYFKTHGCKGLNMMRGTASTQISLDYTDEEDFRRIYTIANALSPLLSLLTDNTPVFEGQVYQGHLARTMVWNNVDSSRQVNPDFCVSPDMDFGTYADFILDSPCILVLENGEPIFTGETPVKEIYKNKEMTRDDIEHILSMFFPDVRLKSFLEIRMADSMDMPFAISYAALLKGIFYNEDNKERFYARESKRTPEEIAAAKSALIKDGYNAKVYGETPRYLLNTIFTFAASGLADEEKVYLAPLLALINREETMAQAAKEHFHLK